MLSGIIVLVVVVALLFEFINGFHDTANAIATSVYTRALTARRAILLAAVMNFVGALTGDKVADTISHGLVSASLEEYVILAALVGAIIWNLFTWWRGIPSSSSHALIGSLIGAACVYSMSVEDIIWSGLLQKVVLPLICSPFIGILIGMFVMKIVFNFFANWSPHRVNKMFLRLQVVSAALVAFAHGTNDAQKTMGIITLALVTANALPEDSPVPVEVKLACAVMMAIGTSVGGWKIMKTMGRGVTKLEPASGFVAQAASAAVIEIMSRIGAPISTTHVITSAVMGVGAAKRASAVKWGIAQDILLTWVITLPISAVLGGASCFIIERIIEAV
ncbi:MAG: inorganic phosphate transporter [Clostridiales Family XIII bacterium]|jgi:PiT family inorganic phosphate transporter|nr:inorganic phosphate transporter [Clostridiales Family XIII bacterium]